MNDIQRQQLKRTISSALFNIDQMQLELAIVRAQCKVLQEEMRAIRTRSKRNQIHAVSNQDASPSSDNKARKSQY